MIRFWKRSESNTKPDRADLSRAVADAQIMIEHATSHGLEIKDETVKPVVDFARKWNDDPSKTSAEEETKFWVGASQLAKLISPSTPEALQTLRHYTENSSPNKVRGVGRWYSVFAWLVLIFTLLTHAYHNMLDTMIAAAEQAAENFASTQSEVAAFVAPEGTGPEFEQAKRTFEQSIKSAHTKYCRSARAWTIQVGLMQGLIPQGEGTIPHALLNWGLGWLPVFDSSEASRLGDPIPAINIEKEMIEYYCGDNKPPSDVWLRTNILSTPLGTDDARRIVQWAKVDRSLIAQFGLPLFYGLLGALANVVRLFGRAVRDAQFSAASGLVYALQVPLGALAGATVGLIIEPATVESTAGLTSLGLAFGVGYAVDLFFSFLDELVGRLTGKSTS